MGQGPTEKPGEAFEEVIKYFQLGRSQCQWDARHNQPRTGGGPNMIVCLYLLHVTPAKSSDNPKCHHAKT